MSKGDLGNPYKSSKVSGKPRLDSAPDSDVPAQSPRRVLTLFDCICIIVGTIIGSGIFKMPSLVAPIVPDTFSLILVWVVGGGVALIGALCFAELTTTYPDRGGDYGYLKRAFHPRVGFAFSWSAFWIVRPANIGAMAMIFGEFAHKALPGTMSLLGFAVLAIVIVSATNLIGVVVGKTAQNILTVAKVFGIVLIIASPLLVGADPAAENRPVVDAAVVIIQLAGESTSAQSGETAEGSNSTDPKPESSNTAQPGWFWLAMVLVMFTYGGWNDIAFVATEVRDPKRNLFRSLVIGTLTVLSVYLLVNLALVLGLGFRSMAGAGENAMSILVGQSLGQTGNRLLSTLICVSCLGSINAMIFTSPRIYWATATDYSALNWLAGDTRDNGWWRAMLLQAVVTLLFVFAFGRSETGFTDLVIANAPFFWAFLGLTMVAMIAMRWKLAGQFSGYRTPLFPLLPLLFLGTCGFMVYRSWTYLVFSELTIPAALMAGWLLLGVGLSFLLNRSPDGNDFNQEK